MKLTENGTGTQTEIGTTATNVDKVTPKTAQTTDINSENGEAFREEACTTAVFDSSGADFGTDRLREAVSKAGGASAVSRQSGVPLSTLNRYLGGQEMRASSVVALARATGVSAGWLLTGDLPVRAGHIMVGEAEQLPDPEALRHMRKMAQEDARAPSLSEYAILPRYDVSASAGGGTLVSSEQVVEFLAFNKDWLRDNLRRPAKDLMLIEARGDSMSPTIRDRDLLIVDVSQGRDVADGAIHVLRMGGTLVVKRLELRYDGGLVIHSDNTRYGPVQLTPTEATEVNIVGQVVWQAGPVRS